MKKQWKMEAPVEAAGRAALGLTAASTSQPSEGAHMDVGSTAEL